MKRPYLLLACLSPVACLMAASGQKGGKNKQKVNDRQLPNVVFIYADDLGYGDLECYGAKNVQTPNVNRLASEGIRFTNAHATAATSTPSRYSMLTGEYAWRRPGTDVAAGNAGMIIRPEDYTMADMFKGEARLYGKMKILPTRSLHMPSTLFANIRMNRFLCILQRMMCTFHAFHTSVSVVRIRWGCAEMPLYSSTGV